MNLALASIVDRAGVAGLPRMFWIGKHDAIHQARGKRLLQFLLLLALAGLAAVITALVKGHTVMGTTSEVSWGILIATYVFLVVSSTGLGLVSSLGHVFGYEVFQPIAKRAMFLALVTLILGFVCIATELERPFLLLKLVILSPNPASPIWWMGTLYGVYLVVIVAELYFLLVGDHARARVGAIITVVAALTIHPTSNLGSVFGLSHSRPYWYGPLLPVYMIATALVSGTALLALAVYLGDYFGSEGRLDSGNSRLMEALRRLLALFLGITVFLTIWRTISGLGGQHYHSYEITVALLTGPLFLHFWLFEVFLGIAVPLWILLGWRGSAPPWVALAAGLTMLGMFVARNDLVYAGQMLSLRPVVGHMGETLRYSPPFKGNVSGFLAYTPSLIEVMVVVGAISAAILLYAAGLRVLRLTDTRQAESRTQAVTEV